MSYYRRQHRRNRQTGTTIEVWDLTGVGAPMDPERDRDGRMLNRWCTYCIEHGELCTHDTLANARGWAAEPSMWCTGCHDAVRDKSCACGDPDDDTKRHARYACASEQLTR